MVLEATQAQRVWKQVKLQMLVRHVDRTFKFFTYEKRSRHMTKRERHNLQARYRSEQRCIRQLMGLTHCRTSHRMRLKPYKMTLYNLNMTVDTGYIKVFGSD